MIQNVTYEWSKSFSNNQSLTPYVFSRNGKRNSPFSPNKTELKRQIEILYGNYHSERITSDLWHFYICMKASKSTNHPFAFFFIVSSVRRLSSSNQIVIWERRFALFRQMMGWYEFFLAVQPNKIFVPEIWTNVSNFVKLFTVFYSSLQVSHYAVSKKQESFLH